MLHGCTPWDAETECELLNKIEHLPAKFRVKCDQSIQNFIQSCLKIKEKERISWEEVYVHPVFDGYFKKVVQENEIMEHKMKKIMNDLRFIVNSQNLDIKNLMSMVGLKESENMDENAFKKFLITINPQVSEEEYKFCFSRLDKNGDGAVSIKELVEQM